MVPPELRRPADRGTDARDDRRARAHARSTTTRRSSRSRWSRRRCCFFRRRFPLAAPTATFVCARGVRGDRRPAGQRPLVSVLLRSRERWRPSAPSEERRIAYAGVVIAFATLAYVMHQFHNGLSDIPWIAVFFTRRLARRVLPRARAPGRPPSCASAPSGSSWSARSRRAPPSPRSARGSRASCTTSSATRSA